MRWLSNLISAGGGDNRSGQQRRAKFVRRAARAGQAWEDAGRRREYLLTRGADRDPKNAKGWGR